MKVCVVIDFPDMEPEGRHADYSLECVTIDLKNGLDGYDWYIDEVTGD